MKKRIRFSALLLLVLSLIPLFLYGTTAEEQSNSSITLEVSASKATESNKNLSGNGKLRSLSEHNIFNFFVKNSDKSSRTKLSYTINGKTAECPGSYFIYECTSAEDYGIVYITVLNDENQKLASFEVELIYEGAGNPILNYISVFVKDFKKAFIEKDRWKMLLQGLSNTLIITFSALVLGIVIGTVVAAVRSTYDKNKEVYRLHGGIQKAIMTLLNSACKLYLTVIRGTPVVVQLLIMYFIIFAEGDDLTVAILTFGINSGAYVAEILRGGIMSVDNGQFEAGRSLGFNYLQTMFYIVIPQMFKSSLPSLCNEFISLLKETSVAGYIPIIDLTKAGNIIRSNSYTAFLPLIGVALIYLTLVIILTRLAGILERRLRRNER